MTHTATTDDSAARFTHHVLRDVRALERLIETGRIETAVRRVGAEQEVVLVNASGRPAPVAREVLDELSDASYTHELALFNLEFNLSPIRVGPDLLGVLHGETERLLERLSEAARHRGASVLLTGIPPCLTPTDLDVANMTPLERYRRLNEATMSQAGGRVRLHITGADELRSHHDSVMLEACNTSFQVHLQVGAEEFASLYNAAQLALGPVLAVACNAPFLFGKRLWAETRIALFQQSIDTRVASPSRREITPRVRFGERWVRDSAVELFEQDLARFQPIMVTDGGEDPHVVLDAGGVPELRCLQLYNSTVYRWNRPCYGISEGAPHLRIECRAIPSGPTVTDQVANAAFWLGLTMGLHARHGDVAGRVDFEAAKSNFVGAARVGLHAGFTWIDGEEVDARTLVERLIEPASEGLAALGVSPGEAERYLGIIAARFRTGQTGAAWLERSAANLREEPVSRPERCAALTAAMLHRQKEGAPVHEWTLARIEEGRGTTAPTVAEYMTTDLFTIKASQSAQMAAFIMDREGLRHMLVEGDGFKLLGLVSYRSLLRVMASGDGRNPAELPVSEIMVEDPITVPPRTTAAEAGRIMQDRGVSCLPVVEDGKLIGVVTERDFMPLAAELLHRLFGNRDGSD